MVVMMMIAMLPAITLTWVAAYNTRASVQKEMIYANNSRMMWVDQYLSELIQQTETLFYSLQINDQLMTSIANMDSADLSIQYQSQQYIKDTLLKAFYANSRKVDNLNFYSHQSQRAFSVDYANSGMTYSLSIRSGPWSRMLNGPINLFFKQSGDGIYAFHGINSFEDKQLIGGFSLRINKQVWKEVADILKSEPESAVFLINDTGELLSGSTSTGENPELQDQLAHLRLSGSELEFKQTPHFFYFMKRVADGQLTVVKAVPVETVNKSASPTIEAGIVTGGSFAIVSLLLSIIVSLRISRPIVRLAKTMRTTRLDHFEMKTVQSSDEIGLLENGYNSMMQRIKELIEVEFRHEIELKNAQLMALQAQINPHFLNNTLHLIGGMALVKQVPDIYRIVQVVGDLLRYSIGAAGEVVKMEDELMHTRNYIFIQEQRFAGRCTINITADERVLNTVLPKFSLQPIVENAFEHGLQPKMGNWSLEIRLIRVRNRILAMIRDNGIGMDGEGVRRLRTKLQSGQKAGAGITREASPKHSGIGLQNVHARIRLHFGGTFGIRVFSKEREGTLIVLVLPVTDLEVGSHV
ncbi:hypothetical protein SD70_13625 [Gordoniibacillus kamchatkensis]|uniref:HAMP domain-containing protein n=1 Tax=Gordoniibacillus kamchatkensis TaxID=1590651 RepID=A0ABR5AHM7_9BACL|nr:sensor histidine kinase [Paenibacillus sp. VKM B-2647]KIL40445.1 hypothetical protein SD70_13625 [Paenibacillus sp. VKM B-2647]